MSIAVSPGGGCRPESIIFDEERGEYICLDTGEVLEHHVIDQGPEWRAFTPEDEIRRNRTGSPLTPRVHDRGLTTFIDEHDINRCVHSPRMKKQIRRLARLQRRVRVSKSDKKLVDVLAMLNNAAARLGLTPAVRDEAATILRKAVAARLVRAPKRAAYVAASIIAASRIHGFALPLREVASVLGVERKEEIWHAIKKLNRKKIVGRARYRAPDPRKYVYKLSSRLGLHDSIAARAAYLLGIAEKYNVTNGKSPVGMAAAAVYLASVFFDDKRTQKEVADAAGITEVTVRNRYRDIVDNFDIEIRL